MKQKIKCILVIDDDEPTAFFTRIILEESGCADSIKIVSTGRQAIGYLSTSRDAGADQGSYPYPELIFLDVNMPAMDCWEFIEEYTKLINDKADMPVMIILTSSVNPDDMMKANAIPVIAGFETKPISQEKLDKIFEKYFPEDNQTMPS